MRPSLTLLEIKLLNPVSYNKEYDQGIVLPVTFCDDAARYVYILCNIILYISER